MYQNMPYNSYPNFYPQQNPMENFQKPFSFPETRNLLKGRPVASREQAVAAQVDLDGSLFIFPDVVNKKIYTKQINMDGTASLKTYGLIEEPVASAPDYITRAEFDQFVKTLKQQPKF